MTEPEDKNNHKPSGQEAVPTAACGGAALGPGAQIGPYKLIGILGEGGYGIVYLAERETPVRRRVALKVIKPGMDSKEVIARFASGMVRCMHELGLLYLAQGDNEKAEKLFKEGIEYGDRELPGKDHPHMLRSVNGLATIRIKQQRFQEARALLERALAGQVLKLDREHPDTLKTLHDFGILHREQGEHDAAEKFLTEALETRQAKLGRNHPHTLESVHQLGVLRTRQSRYEDAEHLFLEAYQGREVRPGAAHPRTIDSLNELVRLYQAWGQPEEAARWRARRPGAGNGGT